MIGPLKIECECCEAEVEIAVKKAPTFSDEDVTTLVPFPDGIYCPFCSSYIELEDSNQD